MHRPRNRSCCTSAVSFASKPHLPTSSESRPHTSTEARSIQRDSLFIFRVPFRHHYNQACLFRSINTAKFTSPRSPQASRRGRFQRGRGLRKIGMYNHLKKSLLSRFFSTSPSLAAFLWLLSCCCWQESNTKKTRGTALRSCSFQLYFLYYQYSKYTIASLGNTKLLASTSTSSCTCSSSVM